MEAQLAIETVAAAAGGKKPCKRCGEVKLIAEFTVHRSCADGHTNECKACAAGRLRTNNDTGKRRKASAAPVVERPADLPSDPDDDECEKTECRVCHALFATVDRMRRHMETVHGHGKVE